MSKTRRAPFGVAAVAGLAILVLSACQVEVDPAPDPAPPGDPTPPGAMNVTVPVSVVAPGEDLPVEASGFPANTAVDIGFGQPRSEYTVISRATTDGQGRMNTIIEVPGWSMRGHPYVVVVTESERDPSAVSDPFVVGRPGDTVRTPGTLTNEGAECPAMRGPSGTLYTLAVRDLEWGPGTEVTVQGAIADVSICMHGTTIDVESIERR